MNPHYEALGFLDIIERLKENALSQQAKDELGGLTPYLNEAVCVQRMAQTTAARKILDACGSPPLAAMSGLIALLELSQAGAMLTAGQLTEAAQFAVACKRMSLYLARAQEMDNTVALYGQSIEDLTDLKDEIGRCITDEKVHDEASSTLRNIRRKQEHLEAQIKEKLSHILQSRKQYLADSYIANRNGHYVLPVQRRYQSQFGGKVIEVSGKGATVFMEPSSIAKLQEELSALAIEEDGEIRRILYELTGLVAVHETTIRRNMEAMEILDVIFARGKLSAAMHARPVEIGSRRCIRIRQGRHPSLRPENCVPLDFEMEEGARGVVITGPNTGGKTVTVKTVGLLSLMAQCGLHIPCEEGSYIAMQDGYWCDIGDSQSLKQNLSTFSGHITNIIHILEHASRDSLVLLDELGSGTDPSEGMGIAVAVLEELRQRSCMFLVTTHYAQVKTYAQEAQDVKSARMAFDPESLEPLYRLEMGKSGESCALLIAKRLGLAPHLLERAHQTVYGSKLPAEAQTKMPAPPSRLIRKEPMKAHTDVAAKFTMGDSVTLLPENVTGIVYRPADKQGQVVVQIKGEKRPVSHTRLKLLVAAAELYPPDYDFSILFDTVENRKNRKKMTKHHDSSIMITYEEDGFSGS